MCPGKSCGTVSTFLDYLSGGDGDDRLIGGHGDDTLSGGADDDSLTGGSVTVLGEAPEAGDFIL